MVGAYPTDADLAHDNEALELTIDQFVDGNVVVVKPSEKGNGKLLPPVIVI